MGEKGATDDAVSVDTIKCIFLCEFHPIAGPKITTQTPEDYITKETFATVNSYVIPRKQLQRSFLSVSLLGIKILGYPVRIDNRQYARNAFYFNLCFVFEPVTRTICYEPVIRKLSEYLLSMELSNKVLSQQHENPALSARLKTLLTQIRTDLNTKQMSMLQEGSSLIPLCVVPFYREVLKPLPYQAPVLLDEFHHYVKEQWDLTTLRICPYVDGFNHIARIAALADVQLGLVQEAIKHLIVLGVARLLPVFQYSNVYRPCPALSKLAKSRELQKLAVLKCSKSPILPARVSDIFRFYAGMNHGATLGESCVRFNPAAVNINEKRAVLFGLMEDLIRRVNKYPITISKNLFTGNTDNTGEKYDDDFGNGDEVQPNLYTKKPAKYSKNLPKQQQHPHYNGHKTLDEVCTGTGLSCQQMEEILSRDQHVILLLR